MGHGRRRDGAERGESVRDRLQCCEHVGLGSAQGGETESSQIALQAAEVVAPESDVVDQVPDALALGRGGGVDVALRGELECGDIGDDGRDLIQKHAGIGLVGS